MKGHDLEIVHDVALFILYDMALRANEYISPKKISQNTSNKIPESFLEKVLWELYEEKLVSNVLIMDQGAQYKINHSGIIHVQDRLTDKTSTISNYKKMGVEWLEIEDAVKTDVVTQASFEQLEYFELRRQILSALSHSDNVMGSGFRSPNSAINGIGGTVNPSDLFPACKDLEDLGFLKIEMDYQDIEEGPLAAR